MPPRRGQFGYDAAHAKARSDWGHGSSLRGIALEKLVPAPRRKSLEALVTQANCRAAARKKSLRPATGDREWFRNEARFAQVQSADRKRLRKAPSVKGAGTGNRIWGMFNVQSGMVSHMRCTRCKRFGKLSVSGVDEKITGLRSIVRLWCRHCQYRGRGSQEVGLVAPLGHCHEVVLASWDVTGTRACGSASSSLTMATTTALWASRCITREVETTSLLQSSLRGRKQALMHEQTPRTTPRITSCTTLRIAPSIIRGC
jgi:hypothetical protein